MDSVDLEVLRTSIAWMEKNQRVLLVTVVRTWGSSPRPEGAMLAIRGDGVVIGSVSGGCIEDDLILKVRENGITNELPEMLTYGVSAEEAHRFGLPCGGTIQLMLEPLGRDSRLEQLVKEVERGNLTARHLDVRTGRVSLDRTHAVGRVTYNGNIFNVVHGPRCRLLVIGAGQLSTYLTQIALGLDYQITVCDPREEYLEEFLPPTVSLVREMPDDAVISMKLDARSAVVTLTHDPKLDDLALMEALKTDAFYVGAIGSRKNNAARRERLKLFDLSDEQIARLRGPAGLYIGSKTPPEIALSILAEMTAAKNGVVVGTLNTVRGAKERENQLGKICEQGVEFLESSCSTS